MKQQRCRILVTLVVVVFATAGLLSIRTAAQSSPLLPAVTFSDADGMSFETWPADFNGDGRVDLVGSTPAPGGTGQLQVRLGAGDGTFEPGIVSAVNARALAVADFNADGKIDVVAQRLEFPAPVVYLVPGNGDGTFGSPTTVAELQATFAIPADVNGDTLPDLVLGEEPRFVHVYPAVGTLTFGPPSTIVVGAFPHGAVVADFTGDTLPEIIVAARYGTDALDPLVTILTNIGGLIFLRRDIQLENRPTHAAAHDLNGDGLRDLIVSARGPEIGSPSTDGGFVYVFFGRAFGEFQTPVIYEVERGPHVLTIGDFTRDGNVDIATGNRSFQFLDDCATNWKDVDSVSIMPGNGDGTFGRRISFALQPQTETWLESTYRDRIASLAPADVNGDGHVDLIGSFGKVLLNAAPHENRLPSALAGEDQTLVNDDVFVLFGGGTDPDHHFLTFEWTHHSGIRVATVPHICTMGFPIGENIFTLTVDDGHGGNATDTVAITRTQTFD